MDKGWESNLIEIENYVVTHNELPPDHDNNDYIRPLASWLKNQLQTISGFQKI